MLLARLKDRHANLRWLSMLSVKKVNIYSNDINKYIYIYKC
jgi:hypothetical protein